MSTNTPEDEHGVVLQDKSGIIGPESPGPNRHAGWALKTGLAAVSTGLLFYFFLGVVLGVTELMRESMTIVHLILAIACLVLSIGAILLGVAGLRRLRVPGMGGRGPAAGGVVLGVLGILWVPLMLVEISEVYKWIRYYAPHGFYRSECSKRLRTVGEALVKYANENGGQYPPDLIRLRSQGLDPSLLFCSFSPYSRTPHTVEEIAEALARPAISAYVYAGAGFREPVAPDTIVVYERLQNHELGIHVLYADGRVEWLDEERARQILGTMQADAPPIHPASQP